jgi:hypothetical protein
LADELDIVANQTWHAMDRGSAKQKSISGDDRLTVAKTLFPLAPGVENGDRT